MHGLCAAVLILLVALPLGEASAESPALVRLEVSQEVGEQDFYDPAGLSIEVSVDHPVLFRLRVFDPSEPEQPMDVADTSSLLELRQAEAGASRVRFADMRQVAPGVYQTSHLFRLAGEWSAVVQPDIEDRSALPPGSTDQVTIRVVPTPVGSYPGPRPMAIVASLILLLLVVWMVILAGRQRTRAPGQPPKEPVTHDTWWNSP